MTAAPSKTVTVNINVQCGNDDSTYIKVNPWVATLKKNGKDSLVFVVDGASNAQDVSVALKSDTASWPLPDRPPYTVGKTPSGKRGLKSGQPTDSTRYPYNILASCAVNGKTRKLVIDPDIFVD